METIGEEINKDGDEVRQERRIRRLHGEKNIWVRIKGREEVREVESTVKRRLIMKCVQV